MFSGDLNLNGIVEILAFNIAYKAANANRIGATFIKHGRDAFGEMEA